MKTRRKTFRITESLGEKLREVAEGKSRKESDVIREALEEYLQAHGKLENCYQMAKRIGVLGGGGKGLPTDLSFNKKHFEGFGK